MIFFLGVCVCVCGLRYTHPHPTCPTPILISHRFSRSITSTRPCHIRAIESLNRMTFFVRDFLPSSLLLLLLHAFRYYFSRNNFRCNHIMDFDGLDAAVNSPFIFIRYDTVAAFWVNLLQYCQSQCEIP